MTYRATSESSDLTPSERLVEARRILFDMGLEREAERMTTSEQRLVDSLGKNLRHRDDGREFHVSVKQLWWLRDLKDKYLL